MCDATPPRRSRRAAALQVAACLVGVVAALALGRMLVAQWTVPVELIGDGRMLDVTVDGTTRRVELPAPLIAVRPAVPVAHRREHQIDGSDSTNMFTFSPRYFAETAPSPYYHFQAWLREEWRYSRWAGLEVRDASGQVLVRQNDPPDEVNIPLPPTFRLTIHLERPEIPRVLELIDADERLVLLEVNRNDKYVRLGRSRSPDRSDLLFWYFPRDPLPPLATLLDLVTRAVAAGLGLTVLAGVVAAALPAPLRWRLGRWVWWPATVASLVWFLAASWYVGTILFARSPHILDAMAYLFQARTFASGALWAAAPPIPDAFPMPFSVIYEDRWFVQYPPGTALALMLGVLAGAPWLTEPVLAAAALVMVALTVRRQYGEGTALLTLVLLVTSPFVLLTAGSFLSHVPALFFTSMALYAVTRYAERPAVGWAALTGLGLGLAFLTREIAPLLFGASIVAAGAARAASLRSWRGLLVDASTVGLIFLLFVAAYFAYNAAVTGEPFLLPRLLVDGRDRWGFGQGVGFYNEHTVAAGLVNTEEQLVSLGFYLSGWPYGVSLAMALLPIALGRARGWDVAHTGLVGLYVVAYAAYYYHGIAFGPRYYFEAVPSMIILTVRGFDTLAERVTGWLSAFEYREPRRRGRQAAGLCVVALLACNAFFFLPRQAELYAGYTVLPPGNAAIDSSVRLTVSGPTVDLERALVVTDEWWYYTAYFARMSCPHLDCPAIFAFAPNDEARQRLRQAFPDRDLYQLQEARGRLTIVPETPSR